MKISRPLLWKTTTCSWGSKPWTAAKDGARNNARPTTTAHFANILLAFSKALTGKTHVVDMAFRFGIESAGHHSGRVAGGG